MVGSFSTCPGRSGDGGRASVGAVPNSIVTDGGTGREKDRREAKLGETGSVINGGNVTIYVTDMARAVGFYSQTLGLRLVYQAGEHWASFTAGGFQIGLHPAGPRTPAPGTVGAVTVGLSVDEPIDAVVSALAARGVVFNGPVTDDGPVRLAFFADPDGNAMYLAEETTPAGDARSTG